LLLTIYKLLFSTQQTDHAITYQLLHQQRQL